ncbi:polysaccharide pyruvyl transferase family protein [Shewanella sp. SM34]|uniref:polysaccharide pyruvyl transferase family protein n=1 Tax=unclassified Shewanella TaxID=196818 RepID=UPI0021D82301|nr:MULTISPECIES: polysaccharide pyruvyl transferase family protein [unclassified Shewanella]MCU8055569.1 polysaccharide pyruvyl transferase family protein [Shewanella sp. SM35]MCU8064491.1 polysaccharide pyruvyl transferase family protein [Shewanella sp. SM34]
MKNVLIVNRGHCDNLGDQAINEAMKNFLIENFKINAYFSDYTSLYNEPININLKSDKHTLKMKLREMLKIILPLKLIWLIRNYSRIKGSLSRDIDLVVVGGGQLILSNTTFDIASATWVFLSKKYKIPIVFSSVGAGTEFNFLNKKLFGYALNNADGICVRDIKSRDIIKNVFGLDSQVAGDIVFTEKYIKEKRGNLTLLGIPCLSVYNTYNDPVSRENYYKIWLSFLQQNKINLSDCSLFYTTNEDYKESVNFKKFLESKNIYDVNILYSQNLILLESLLMESKTVVSGRMHGLILALNYDCNIIVFPISSKLQVFKESVEDKNFSITDFKNNIKLKTLSYFNAFFHI